jgi:hypothetical protein
VKHFFKGHFVKKSGNLFRCYPHRFLQEIIRPTILLIECLQKYQHEREFHAIKKGPDGIPSRQFFINEIPGQARNDVQGFTAQELAHA